MRKGKERWHPATYREFLAWGTEEGVPPEGYPSAYGELKRFFGEVWEMGLDNPVDDGDAELSLYNVYTALAAGRGWQGAFDELRDAFDLSALTKREYARLADIPAKASNQTRHDANWGSTPDEMAARFGLGDTLDLAATPMGFADNPQTPIVRKTIKIGRNDPCPCGSGKKYKKCCGKNA